MVWLIRITAPIYEVRSCDPVDRRRSRLSHDHLQFASQDLEHGLDAGVIQTAPSICRKRIIVSFLVLMVTALTAGGCAVRLIGDYDDIIDKGFTDVEQKADLYLAKLQSTPDTPYDQSFYDGINASLAVLRNRTALLPKYNIIGQQITNLMSQVNNLQSLAKEQRSLSQLPS